MELCNFKSAELHNKDQSQNVFHMFFYEKRHAEFNRCGFVEIRQRQLSQIAYTQS
jgi:hypothetical protein